VTRLSRSDLRRLRGAVAISRCPDCNQYELEIQDIRSGVPSVLCSNCGWFTAVWRRL
jgi:hypothetical protein